MHLQPGKASPCDAITWGTAIGGRNATVPEKASGSVAAIGRVIEQLSGGAFARYRSKLFRDGDAAG